MTADYTEGDIVLALREVGISARDDVFLHSNLGFFGQLEGCRSADGLCAAFLRSIREVIGEEGTVTVPTFSYSFCHSELYDPYVTKTTCGMFAEYMLRKNPGNRTLDPNFSVCGEGPNMRDYLNCNTHDTFGEKSFWELFRKNKGKIICLNFDSGSTFIHYIERQNNVSYRYNKAFNGQLVVDGKIVRDYAVHFVHNGQDDAPCMERVDRLCKEHGISRQTNLGRGTVLAFSCNRYYDFFSDLLKTRPRVLCKEECIQNG